MISLKKRKKKFLPENFLPSKGFSLYLTLKPPESRVEEVEGGFYLSRWRNRSGTPISRREVY